MMVNPLRAFASWNSPSRTHEAPGPHEKDTSKKARKTYKLCEFQSGIYLSSYSLHNSQNNRNRRPLELFQWHPETIYGTLQ
jgi:hypothetical protein